MSVVAVLARWLLGMLPAAERRALIREITESAQLAEPDTQDQTHAGTSAKSEEPAVPDWPLVWETLLDASAATHSAADQLSSRGIFFDFDELARDARALQRRVDDAYELMCHAGRLEELQLESGDDLDTVRRAVELCRADRVDAQLASWQDPTPADAAAPADVAADAVRWSIDYRSTGGFVATGPVGDGTSPQKFWGAAPTARSASHTLRWYFRDQPPQVVFDPPLPPAPRPLAPFGPDADLSLEGPSTADLLAQRGSIYDQHIAACQRVREQLRGRGDVPGYLAERAACLNATDPQLADYEVLGSAGDPDNLDQAGFAYTVQWVPTALVVATHHPRWGEFGGHRDTAPQDIAQGLMAAADLDRFTDILFGDDELSLHREPGWAGPLYTLGSNGNHRVHAARMLGLPWLAASVYGEATATSWNLLGLLGGDPDSDRGGSYEKRLNERKQLVAGLIRRGIIDGELTGPESNRVLRCRRLPAAWLLRAPRSTTTVNTVYESRYPGALARLGIPAQIGTDPDAWAAWLS